MSVDPTVSKSRPSVVRAASSSSSRRPGVGPRRASKSVDLLQPFRRPMTMYNGQTSPENTQAGALSQFLSATKTAFLQAATEGKGPEWTIVMGNEAGDLDSIASAIAYSWLESVVHQNPTVALIQMESDDLRLRPENLHAFSIASLDPSHADLLTLSDLPIPPPTTKFALVDHNHLLPRWSSPASSENPDFAATVTAIVDHHADEGHHTSASPRVVEVPTGSCTSLVTRLLDEASAPIPPDLATLLLSAILIDTDGLRPAPQGKAEPADREAAALLAPRSVLAPALPLHAPNVQGEKTTATDSERPLKALYGVPAVMDLTRTLQARKFDIGSLGTRDLLRRDYKEYALLPSWSTGSGKINVGLSTVPVSLKDWLPRDPDFWSATDGWMDERGLTVLGVLTSYRTKGLLGGEGKGKHRRQLLFVVRQPTPPPSQSSEDQPAPAPGFSVDLEELERRLWAGLEGSDVLRCEKKELKKKKHGVHVIHGAKHGPGDAPRRVRLYKQGNASATRKAVAPLVRSIVEGDGSGVVDGKEGEAQEVAKDSTTTVGN